MADVSKAADKAAPAPLAVAPAAQPQSTIVAAARPRVSWMGVGLLVALAFVPVIAKLIDQPFYITLFTRIVIFAIAAVGLHLILGYGAMVSFGHALYLGVGAYAVGVLSYHGISSGWAHLFAAMVVGAIAAVIVGWVCMRTTGVAFIMITLAFAQMFYFLAVSLKTYGGDDGLSIASRSNFGFVDLASNTAFYYVSFFVLVVVLALLRIVIASRFGMVLRGCKSNERRMAALGFPTLRYKLAAYVISALICTVAGVLLANLTRFASPSYMQWQASGDLIVMIVFGGIGTLVGPVVGATALLLLEEVLASWTDHWMAILGPLIVVVVLASNRGIFGLLDALGMRRKIPR